MAILSLSLSIALIGAIAAFRMRSRYRQEFIIREGFAGLLYDRGRLVGSLVPGRHVRWGSRYDVAVIDLHEMSSSSSVSSTTAWEEESISVTVLLAEHLFSVRKAAAQICQEREAEDRLPKSASLGGVPLRILLSERSSPGALLRESLRIRPSQRDD